MGHFGDRKSKLHMPYPFHAFLFKTPFPLLQEGCIHTELYLYQLVSTPSCSGSNIMKFYADQSRMTGSVAEKDNS